MKSTTSSISSSDTNVPCTRIGLFIPLPKYSISPYPNSLSAPPLSIIVLESTLEDTINAIRVGILALISPVITLTEGLCVATNI